MHNIFLKVFTDIKRLTQFQNLALTKLIENIFFKESFISINVNTKVQFFEDGFELFRRTYIH